MSYVFICGALRSGTTLTHLMLDAHPELENPGEFDFLFDVLIGKEGREPSAESFAMKLRRDRIFNSKNISIDPSCHSYSDLLYSLIEQIQNGRTVCLNIHRNFDFALRYFPDAKFVHILRDPRDVAKSSIKMGWAGTTYHGVDHWLESENSWDRLMKRASEDQIFEIRYAELIANTKSTLSALCQFIGRRFDQGMLSYYKGSTYSQPDLSLIEQWRDRQTTAEIELVEYKTRHILQKRGYKFSINTARRPSLLCRIKLFSINKYYRYIFSIRRYGMFLFVINKIITIFPNFPNAKKYRVRINEIQGRFLK